MGMHNWFGPRGKGGGGGEGGRAREKERKERGEKELTATDWAINMTRWSESQITSHVSGLLPSRPRRKN